MNGLEKLDQPSCIAMCSNGGRVWVNSCILAISWQLITILKKNSSHCYQSTLVTVTFIAQMFSLSQSEISFDIIMAELTYGVRISEAIHFAENIASLLIFMQF